MASRTRVEPSTPARTASSLRAAGRRLDTLNGRQIKAFTVGVRQEWQSETWDYYDAVPEVGFGVRYKANAMSRLRLVVGYQPSPGVDPIIPNLDDPPDGFDPGVYEVAMQELARLDSGDGIPAMWAKVSTCFDLPGECFLVGWHDPIDDRDRVDVFSTDEVDFKGTKDDGEGTITLKPLPGEKAANVVLQRNVTPHARLWRKHARFGELADSPFRSALEDSETLKIMRRKLRAQALSQLNGGVWWIPEQLKLGPPVGADGTPDGDADDPLTVSLLEVVSAPINDPSAASALAPFVIHADAEHLDKLTKWEIARPHDEGDLAIRAELRAVVATALDLPEQAVLGMGDTKFRNAEMITKDLFRAHLEPGAIGMCGSITAGWFTPALVKRDVKPDVARLYPLWFDESGLVGDPDRGAAANDGHDRGTISDRAWRTARGFSEEDAPDDDELERRAQLSKPFQSKAGPTQTPGAPEAAPPIDESVAPDDGEAALRPLRTLRSSARRPLGERLADLEVGLRLRLQAAADTAITKALEKSGAMARQAARGPKAQAVGLAMQGIPNRRVCATIGKVIVEQLAVDPGPVIDKAIAELQPKWAKWVTAAQQQARAAIAREGGLDDDLADRYEPLEADNRQAGWELFAALLTGLGHARLYDPDPAVPVDGEFDDLVVIPAGLVRHALARAGGTLTTTADIDGAPIDANGNPAGGVATGRLADDIADDADLETEGYVWLYGDEGTRVRPFIPHRDLDGAEFSGWDDPQLANPGSFPPVEFLFPGDHGGCQCERVPRLVARADRVPDPVSPSALIERGTPGRATDAEREHATSSSR